MGTNIVEDDRYIVTRFYGGKDRGVSYQINIRDRSTNNVWKYIQISEKQLIKLVTKLLKYKTKEAK